MTYKEILKSIYKEKAAYEKKINSHDRRYLVNFLEKYPTNDFDMWLNVPVSTIVALNILSKGYEDSITMKNLEILDYVSSETIARLADIIASEDTFENNKRYAEDLYEDALLFNSERMDLKIHSNSGTYQVRIPFDCEDCYELVYDIRRYGNNIDLFFICILAKFKSFYGDLVDRYNGMIKQSIIRKHIIEQLPITPDIETNMQKIYDYVKSVTNGLTNKEINKTINAYKSLVEKIKLLDKNEEIKNIDVLFSNYISEELKNKILEYVYDHNAIYYKSLMATYESKKNNSILEYIAYFKSIGLDFNKLKLEDKHNIMRDNLDTIKNKMRYISKMVYIEDYFKVLIANDINSIMKVCDYVKKEYLTNDFIKENVNILIKDDVKTTLESNINILLKHKVNFKKYEDKSFLLVDTTILINNINLLKKLNIPFEKCIDLSLLKESLDEKVALFIEVGLYEYMISNPDILNADIDLAKRIILTKEANGEVFEEGKIKNIIINPDKFFIPSDKVDSYILDRTHNNFVSTKTIFLPLETKKEHYYEIDGVIIPKSRVKTNPVKLESIIKPSLYTDEDVKKLEKLR